MKKRISVILALAIIVQLVACGDADVKGRLSDEPGGGKWVDSDLKGAVKAENVIRLQDDFAAAANQKTISSVQTKEGINWSPDADALDLIQERYREVLNDENLTGANVEVLRTFESLVLNWDERNKLGVEPIRKYIDDIQSISSIDELTQYQSSLERNPFNIGLIMPGSIDAHMINVDKSILNLDVAKYSLGQKESYQEFSDSALELKEAMDGTISYLLGRLGYDEKSIKDTLKGNYEVERFLANNECRGLYNRREMLYNAQTDRAGLEQYTNGYPLVEILDGRGFSGANSFNVDYKLLGSLHKIYDQKHLSELKSFFIVQMLRCGYPTLDHETIVKTFEIGSVNSGDTQFKDKTDNEEFYTMVQQYLFMPAIDELYLEKYFPDNTRTDKIRDLIEGLKDSYTTMIYEEEWLSDETKAAAVEKLNNMVVQVVKPSNIADYSAVTVKSYDEGGTILDAAASAARFLNVHKAEIAANPELDRGFWDIYEKELSTTTINAFYRPDHNSFYIMAGWVACGDVIFGDEMTDEEFMGCIGVVVGHEISHGFDGNGSHYDKYGRRYDDDGNETDWMSSEDRSRLDERVNKLGSYFSLARPIPGKQQVEGIRVMNEATADMAGLKAILYMARDIEDFDYDGFFRGYAALWANQTEEKDELELMDTDAHPLAFHRVNISLQQFEEFIQTYDIKPGDGMYLEPEKRINVW